MYRTLARLSEEVRMDQTRAGRTRNRTRLVTRPSYVRTRLVNLLSWYQKKIWTYQASLVHGILLVVYVANFPLLILKNKMIEKVKDICEVANFLELDFLVYLDSCRVKYSH